jgi:hypothetical protein
MKIVAKTVTVVAALAMSAQPCFAAGTANSGASLKTASTAPPAERLDFDLKPHLRSAAARNVHPGPSRFDVGGSASASLTLAASQQTASEAQDQPRRRSPGTTTWLVLGGVVLLVLVAAAVASASPTPGPSEGAFD